MILPNHRNTLIPNDMLMFSLMCVSLNSDNAPPQYKPQTAA